MDDHVISRRVLDRFTHHTATSEEQRAVLRHLLSGCRSCQGYLGRTWVSFLRLNDNLREISPPNYEKALECAVSLSPRGADSLAELESHPPLRQELLVRNHPRYWRRELCEELIDGAQGARFMDAGAMGLKARLAVALSERLKPGGQRDAARLEDLRTRAWTGMANALRVSGDLNLAEGAFLRARSHMEAGTGLPSLRANQLRQFASLRFDQRRFDVSRRLIREAMEILRDLHDRQEVASCLLQEATTVGEGGDPVAGLRLLDESERVADPEADPRMGLIISQNRIRFLNDSGQAKAALELHLETEALFSKIADPLIRIKLRWLKGQLLAASGQLEPAATVLGSTQQAFLELGNRYEAALASIELASVLAKMGRQKEVRLLAAAAFQEMASRGIRREALASLILLRNSA